MTELFSHFMSQRSLDELPEHTLIGPDQFPLLADSKLSGQHDFLSGHFETEAIVATDDRVELTKRCAALLDRSFYYDLNYGHEGGDPAEIKQFFWGGPATYALRLAMEQGIELNKILSPLLKWLSMGERTVREPRLLDTIFDQWDRSDELPDVKTELIVLRSKLLQGQQYQLKKDLVGRIDQILGPGLWQLLIPGEAWSDAARVELQQIEEQQRKQWIKLLEHCQRPEVKKKPPKPAWVAKAQELCSEIAPGDFRTRVVSWLHLVPAGPGDQQYRPLNETAEESLKINQGHELIIRGLLFCLINHADDESVNAIAQVTQSAFHKLKKIGPRSKLVGETGLDVLAQINSKASKQALKELATTIKQKPVQKKIAELLEEV